MRTIVRQNRQLCQYPSFIAQMVYNGSQGSHSKAGQRHHKALLRNTGFDADIQNVLSTPRSQNKESE
ncbi:MAG TPA: hypothetical protein PKV82_08750, partial [Anaerolineae bacterium]|nr:hypothetical protein [Anaerolineae bacterium]